MSLDLFTAPWPRDYREQFWHAYPRKVSKITALKALDKVKDRGDVPFEKILSAIEKYKAYLAQSGWRPDPKHPATWLNGGCWDDDFRGASCRPSFADIAMGAIDRNVRH